MYFDGAKFSSGGYVNFSDAEFAGGQVDFSGAEFSGGHVNFDFGLDAVPTGVTLPA